VAIQRSIDPGIGSSGVHAHPGWRKKHSCTAIPKPVAIGSVDADEFQIARRKAVALFELPKAGRQSE
jgi:hypothetical protein